MKKVSEVKGCEGCPMARLFPENNFVAPKIGTGSKLVIAEAPGETEATRGEPLVGGSGQWFNIMAEKAGIIKKRPDGSYDRSQVTLANCIQCRPPKNVFPTDGDAKSYISSADATAAVGQCLRNHVQPLLHGRKWSRVYLLGDKPLKLIAHKDGGIFQWRGSPVEIEGLGLIGMPTLHPAYIARDQIHIRTVINDFAKSIDQTPEFYTLWPSMEDVKKFTAKSFAFDIETYGFTKDIRCVGLSAKPGVALTVPFRGPYISELKRIFGNAESVVGHNCIQFDLPILSEYGVVVRPGSQVWDTMLMQHLCFPDFPHDLEFVASQFTSKPAWKAGDKGAGGYWELRCNRDTDVTWQSFLELRTLLGEYGLEALYKNVQVPLARICKLMNVTGFKVNPNRIWEVREKILGQMAEEEKHLPERMRTQKVPKKRREEAPPGSKNKHGKPIKYIMVDDWAEVKPWRSTVEKVKWLYEELGLPRMYDPKDGRLTTGKAVLEKLARKFPEHSRAIRALSNLNKWDELVTTFCKPEMVSIDRMHPHFNVHGTGSGRLSSSDPNLQNIPEKSRFIYVPSHTGWKIIDVDYSGIENRLTAYLAGDHDRLERFRVDPKFSEHKLLASRISGIPYGEIEKSSDPDSVYSKAKHVVHGTNYGLGPLKASRMYDIPLPEARDLFAAWKKEIAPTIRWQEKTAEEAKDNGVLTTVFGRKRWFYTSSYFTESLSFLPQSTAADVIFRAMIGLMWKRIDWPEEKVREVVKIYDPLPEPARLLLQVHDSLIFECPSGIVDDVVAVVKRVMEQPWPELGGLVLPIGVKVGDSWGEAE